MKALGFLVIIAIFAFGLTPFLPSGEAEMSSLTDEEMEARLLGIWDISLSIKLSQEINAVQKGDLSDETEENEALRIETEYKDLRIEKKARDDAIRKSLAIKGPPQVYRRIIQHQGDSGESYWVREVHQNSREVIYTPR
jgi:hypothetical protein